MGISNDIRPPKKSHQTNGATFNISKDDDKTKEITIPQQEKISPEIERDKAEKNSLEKKENDDKEKQEKQRAETKEQLENQFFSHQLPKKDPTKQKGQHEEKKSGHSIIRLLLWIIIFSAIGVAAYYKNPLYKTSSSTTTSDKNENYSGEIISQDYVNGTSDTTSSIDQAQTSTTTPAATTPATTETAASPAAATTPAIDKATISIKVLNGNGITGSAEQIKTTLTSAGFTVAKVANARNWNYTKTYIYYQTGKENEANLVRDALSTRDLILQLSDTISGSYNIVVVVGKK